MKKQVRIIMLIGTVLFGFLSTQANALNYVIVSDKKVDTLTIKTSAVCKMCKERLEHDLSFEKGVKSVELDLDTKELTIVYMNGKNTVDNLKKAVTKVGYDADELQADQKAHDRLPACCQKGVEPH